MTLLEKLQAEYKALVKRYGELRKMLTEKPDDFTDELRAEKVTIEKRREALIDEIKAEQRAIELDELDAPSGGGSGGGDPDDPSQRSGMEVPDQKIYRGSDERVIGQQIKDVFFMIRGRGNVQGSEKRYAENRKREVTLLEKNTGFRAAGDGQIQGIASDGGMFLSGSKIVDFMDRGFNNSEVLRRCRRVTLGAGEVYAELIDVDETSRADGSRGGGIRVYTEAELGLYDATKTSFRKIRIEPKKLTGLFYVSEELDMNAPLVGQEVGRLFDKDFVFKKQDQVMEGTGAGQAMGIQSCDCKVSISKEIDQKADTIVTENILKMIQQFAPAGGGSPAFFYNRNCFTQLMKMSYDVGTGGELAKLFIPPRDASGIGAIWGYPAIPIEQAETLGAAGDIWLTDFSSYIVADKGDVLQAVSMHVQFLYGQITIRFTAYFDGQPRDAVPLTPFKDSSAGSDISPFVRIADR